MIRRKFWNYSNKHGLDLADGFKRIISVKVLNIDRKIIATFSEKTILNFWQELT